MWVRDKTKKKTLWACYEWTAPIGCIISKPTKITFSNPVRFWRNHFRIWESIYHSCAISNLGKALFFRFYNSNWFDFICCVLLHGIEWQLYISHAFYVLKCVFCALVLFFIFILLFKFCGWIRVSQQMWGITQLHIWRSKLKPITTIEIDLISVDSHRKRKQVLKHCPLWRCLCPCVCVCKVDRQLCQWS